MIINNKKKAGLGFVSLAKRKAAIPFQGRESLLKTKKNKIKRKLVTFTVEDETLSLWGHEEVYRNGVKSGYLVAAGEQTPKDNNKRVGAIGLAYIHLNDTNDILNKEYIMNASYEIDVEGIKYPCKVHFAPVYDPKGLQMKQDSLIVAEEEEEEETVLTN